MRLTEILTIKKQEENAIIFIMPGGGQAFGEWLKINELERYNFYPRDLINELKKLNTTSTYIHCNLSWRYQLKPLKRG